MKKSTQKLKKITRVLFGRTAFVIIAILMQFAFFFILINWLYRYSVLIHLLFVLLGMFVVIHIFNEDTNSAFKMAWIIPVLIIPIFGTMIYVFVNLQLGTKIMRSRLASIDKQLQSLKVSCMENEGWLLIYIMPVTFRHIMIMILSSFRLASSSLKR